VLYYELDPVVGFEPTTDGLQNLFRAFSRSWPQLGITGLTVEYKQFASSIQRRFLDPNSLNGTEIQPYSSQNGVVKAAHITKRPSGGSGRPDGVTVLNLVLAVGAGGTRRKTLRRSWHASKSSGWRVLDRDQGVVSCVEDQGPPLDLPPLPLVSQAVRRADADPGPPHEQNRDWPSLLNAFNGEWRGYLPHVVEELQHQPTCFGIDLLGIIGYGFQHRT